MDVGLIPQDGQHVKQEHLEALLGPTGDANNLRGWNALLNIFRCQYFHRGWILQEVTVFGQDNAISIRGRKAARLRVSSTSTNFS
jgi:hypothetical protein